MRARGLQPTSYTYNALIKAECHAGNLERVRSKPAPHSPPWEFSCADVIRSAP